MSGERGSRLKSGREAVSLVAAYGRWSRIVSVGGELRRGLRGLLASVSPEAPPPIELSAAGALVPAPYGQNDDSSDREDHEIARHVTFRGARTGAPFPLIQFTICERTRRG